MHVQHSLFCSNVVSGVSSPGECNEFKMSISSHHAPLHFWLSCKLKQWTGCAISSGVLFQSVFETQLFDISTFFDSWNPRQFCVCVEMLFLKFHQMLWAVKHGLKSDGRNEELKEIIEADCVKISRIKKIWNLCFSQFR